MDFLQWPEVDLVVGALEYHVICDRISHTCATVDLNPQPICRSEKSRNLATAATNIQYPPCLDLGSEYSHTVGGIQNLS